MLLDVIFKDLFIVGVPVLEEVNHHDDGLKDELSQLPIFVGGHQLEEFVQDLVMEEQLIVGILKLLQFFQDDLNLLLMQAGLFKQEQVIDIGVVSELVGNESEINVELLQRGLQVTDSWDLAEVLPLSRDRLLIVVYLQQFQ